VNSPFDRLVGTCAGIRFHCLKLVLDCSTLVSERLKSRGRSLDSFAGRDGVTIVQFCPAYRCEGLLAEFPPYP